MICTYLGLFVVAKWAVPVLVLDNILVPQGDADNMEPAATVVTLHPGTRSWTEQSIFHNNSINIKIHHIVAAYAVLKLAKIQYSS